MKRNVVIPIVLILVILVGGWAYLNQFSDVSPGTYEKLPSTDDKKPSSPKGEDDKGGTLDIFQGLLPGLQGLVNASAEPVELLEFVMNVTDRLSGFLDEADAVTEEQLASMLDFFEELEVELQRLIDEGASPGELLDHVTAMMGGLKESGSGKSK